MQELSKQSKPEGLNRGGNSTIRRILNNPTYVGMIKVPSYYDEPERLIDGNHQPIIDNSTWWSVQLKLSGKQNNRHSNEEVPLRGSLHCHCGRYLTAGNRKGKRSITGIISVHHASKIYLPLKYMNNLMHYYLNYA